MLLIRLLLILVLSTPLAAMAQQGAAPAPAPVTAEASTGASEADTVQLLIDALSDDQQRERLLGVLRNAHAELVAAEASGEQAEPAAAEAGPSAEAEEPAEPDASTFDGGLIGALMSNFAGQEEITPGPTLAQTVQEQFTGAAGEITARVDSRLGGQHTINFLLWAGPGWLVVILATILVFRSRWLAKRRAPQKGVDYSGLALLKAAARKAIYGLLPIVLIGVAALVWVLFAAPTTRQAQLFFAVVTPILLAAGAYMLVYLVLTGLIPSRGWRLVHYAQHRVLPWIAVMAGLAGLVSSLGLFPVRIALGQNVAETLAFCLEIAVTLLGLRFVFRHRLIVRNLLVRGHPKDRSSGASNFFASTLEALARSWHLLALAFIVANVIGQLLGLGSGSFIQGSLWSLVLVFAGIAALTVLNASIAKSNQRLRFRRQTTATRLSRRYLDIGHLLLQGAVICVVIAAMVHLWGFNLLEWLGTEGGQRLSRPLLSLILVPVILYAIWVTVDILIARALQPTNSRGQLRPHSGRIATLLPLIRNLVFVVLCVITVIAVLANLGIDVTPLLAGAGVIGLAFSFGAQQLVQDVITGFFIIFEDTIAIGDVVSTGDRTGTVEGLSIRTVKIRDGSGALHSIPFSQIKALQNNSRGFGIFPVNVALAYDADPDKTMTIMREIGADLSADPEFGPKMLAPLEIWGVDTFSADGVTIKGAIKCPPLQQWGVGREFNRRLKHRLDEAGIRFQGDQQRLLMRELYGATKFDKPAGT